MAHVWNTKYENKWKYLLSAITLFVQSQKVCKLCVLQHPLTLNILVVPNR